VENFNRLIIWQRNLGFLELLGEQRWGLVPAADYHPSISGAVPA